MHLIKGLRLFFHVVWLGTGQFQSSIGTYGTIGTNRKAQYSNGSIGECLSLRGLRLVSHVVWLGTGQFQWSIGTNGTISTNRKAPYSNGSIGEYASH